MQDRMVQGRSGGTRIGGGIIMNNLFFFLLPLLLAKQAEHDVEPEPEDAFEDFPVGYLRDMYRVQADVTAERYEDELDPETGKLIRERAETVIDANERLFCKAEEAIGDLLAAGQDPVQRQCIATALKDYCDHLSDLLNKKM